MKKPPDGFCTHIFFASAIILILSGIFLHRLSRIIKVELKLIRVPTTEFSRQKFRNRRHKPKSITPSWKSIKRLPNVTPKTDYLFTSNFQSM